MNNQLTKELKIGNALYTSDYGKTYLLIDADTLRAAELPITWNLIGVLFYQDNKVVKFIQKTTQTIGNMRLMKDIVLEIPIDELKEKLGIRD